MLNNQGEFSGAKYYFNDLPSASFETRLQKVVAVIRVLNLLRECGVGRKVQ